MPNKPQNLGKWLDGIRVAKEGSKNSRVRELTTDERILAFEVARATCDAVSVGEISNPDADSDAKKSQVPRIAEMLGRQAGFNSAVKAQKDKERSWMGGKR